MPSVKFNYNQSINGFKDPRIKGLGGEVSALIEEGLKDNPQRKSAIPYLFNEKKSNKQTERVYIEDGYDLMHTQVDGDSAENDQTNIIGHKDVSHIIFSKNVTLTETMLEDAYYEMDPSIELKARALPDAYWRTKESFGQGMYINGEKASFVFDKARVDTTTYDGMPLFSANHTYGDAERGHAFGTQSNLFYVVNNEFDAGFIAEVLSAGAAAINQMLNSNGEAQDFEADTVLAPRGVKTNSFVDKVRRAIGSEYFPGTANNDINTQHGQWNFVPMSLWKPDTPELMIMSQDAKKMMKSQFYDRTGLKIRVWETPGSGNLNWKSRTRFSAVHVDYKHVCKIKFFKEEPGDTSGMTKLVL